MQNSIYEIILENTRQGKKMLAILLDPDKCKDNLLASVLASVQFSHPDFIFIGGSTSGCTDDILESIKHIPVKKILFPGSSSQFSPKADGLLFLSLISGRNAEYLIGQHIDSALEIKSSGIEVIPTGYILIGEENQSAVERVSETLPIPSNDVELCVKTAVAGEMLGLKLTYLEAGSGAKKTVPLQMISEVKKHVSHPLIVGGGVRTVEKLKEMFSAGADLLVVGNLFEKEPEKISAFVDETRHFFR